MTKTSEKTVCGDANPGGNVQMTHKGGCRESVEYKLAYRCVGCGVFFHRECIIKHFELEKEHDYGREEERKEIKKRAQAIFEEFLKSLS